MAKKDKEPRFFCDNCGEEVSNDTKACPGCGRLFVSVRCPACGFSGEEKIFKKGCPSCGYSAVPGVKNNAVPGAKKPKKKKKPRNEMHYDELPKWAYFLSFAALLAVMAFLSYFITR